MNELTKRKQRREPDGRKSSGGPSWKLQVAVYVAAYLVRSAVADYRYYYHHYNYASGNYCLSGGHTTYYCSSYGLYSTSTISDSEYTSSASTVYINPTYDAALEWCCDYRAYFYVWNDLTNVWDHVSDPVNTYSFISSWNS